MNVGGVWWPSMVWCAVPCEVFGRVQGPDGRPAYEVRVCSAHAEVDSAHVVLEAPWRLASLARCDTVIVPGIEAIIARRAAMSTRTLSRRFREQTGATPAQWIIRARVREARRLLETTSLSVELVATNVGFGSSAVLRQRFARLVGTSPRAYRSAFGRA